MCSGSCVTTDLYIKNLGAGEQGLGLNNDPSTDHELWFAPGQNATPVIQLDVTAIKGLTSGASFTMDSTTDGEWWAVFGATGAGATGTVNLLSTGNDELSHAFASWGTYNFYDFVSLGTYNGGHPRQLRRRMQENRRQRADLLADLYAVRARTFDLGDDALRLRWH